MAAIGSLETIENAVTAAEVFTPTGDGTTIGGNGFASADGGTPFYVIDDGISNAKLSNMSTKTYKGRTTAGSGNPEDLTAAQMQADLSIDDLITLSGVSEGSANLGSFTGTKIADNQTIKAALQALETALEAVSSSDVPQWKDVGNGVTLYCTSGVTSSHVTKVSGVVTITPPSGQRVAKIRCIVPVSDCVYTDGTRSNGFKIKIDNSANGETPGFNLEFLEYSTFGTATALAPMLYNSVINISNKISEEMNDSGVFSIMFYDIPSNAPNGGLIQG